MKSLLQSLGLAFALGLVAAAPARAQILTSDRVQIALEATDQRIEQAQRIVAASSDPRAQVEVTAAVDIQARARTAFDAAHLRMALDLTLEARGHADRAIAIVRGLPDPDRVTTQVERTREILDRARQRIEECDQPRARNLLRIAGEMQDRAESAVAASRYLAALELTMGARDRAFRALRLCNLEDDLRGSVELALRRTDDILARARDVVTPSAPEEARRGLAEATELQTKAESEFRAEHFAVSLRLTQAARAMAHRAIRLARGG
jgi:hypothetical protein